MAASSLFALLDDIATVLDDVAVMSKVAAKKTAGVLGDDLALNAQQVSGVTADRELPVVWAVAKGSLRNKVILVPAALLISALASWAVMPLLMIGGAYLCFEGFEKLVHSLLHRAEHAAEKSALVSALHDPTVDLREVERDKIKGAIRTDFILSAEIIVIALGVVASYPFLTRLVTLCVIALIMTIGVYGFVAAIVKLDDLGLWLQQRNAAFFQGCGLAILWAAPWLMRALSFLGTLAMFLVGGSIIVHGAPFMHHWLEETIAVGGLAGALLPSAIDLATGLLVGAACLAALTLLRKLFRSTTSRALP
jgi:uncharacterized protein